MNPTELRIGNYIFRKNRIGKWFKIKVNRKHFKLIYAYPENYKPIPLNEQWLKAFGFDKDGAYWFHANLNIATSKTKTGEILLIPNSKYALELKYAHQLQNLYFALTEKELQP